VILHAHQEWYLAKHFIPRYTNMENWLADFNTKPQSGDTFHLIAHHILGVSFDPPSGGTNHYKLGNFANFSFD
jgi:hypothetical protein